MQRKYKSLISNWKCELNWEKMKKNQISYLCKAKSIKKDKMKNDTLELSIILKGNMLRLFYKIMHAKHFIL